MTICQGAGVPSQPPLPPLPPLPVILSHFLCMSQRERRRRNLPIPSQTYFHVRAKRLLAATRRPPPHLCIASRYLVYYLVIRYLGGLTGNIQTCGLKLNLLQCEHIVYVWHSFVSSDIIHTMPMQPIFISQVSKDTSIITPNVGNWIYMYVYIET